MVTGSNLAQVRLIPGKHYNGRGGMQVTHIDLHIMCGTLEGSDSWFRNPKVKACSHYGVGETGLIYQWIDETNGSWADANRSADCSGVTIEHEGGLGGVPCTRECVEASARLCADIARRYGWDHLRHDGLNGNIWLHREIPGTTHADCPDRAPNGLPVQQVIDKANNILRGDDMVTAQDKKDIAAEVWNYIISQYPGGNGDPEPAWVKLFWAKDRAERILHFFDMDDKGRSAVGNAVWCQPIGSGDPKTEQAAWVKAYWTWRNTQTAADNAYAEKIKQLEAKQDRLEQLVTRIVNKLGA